MIWELLTYATTFPSLSWQLLLLHLLFISCVWPGPNIKGLNNMCELSWGWRDYFWELESPVSLCPFIS